MQPFLISEFKTGINSYLQPWIRPIDAFQPLINAYINRGAINKRYGYTRFGNQLADTNPVMGLMRYINEATGVNSLLAASTVHLYIYNAGTNAFDNVVLPANFTGNITNFFNSTNWQPVAGGSSFLIMANNKDPVTYYNGAAATQPTLTTLSTSGQTLVTCQDVKIYKNRALYIRPTLSTSAIPENQTIIWSAQFNPTDVDSAVAGHGGLLAAPTGDIIIDAEFLRDDLIVFFSNSTWKFVFTGNQSNPFIWQKINNSKSSNAPYGVIPYDERCTSLGSTGLIACDGVNVQRYDLPIIDYYEENFSEQYYAQTFAQRYDNLNQGWMLYVSTDTPFPLVGGVAPGSDSALIYNFLENSWATYKWSIPLTCLGTFYSQQGTRWQDLVQSWEVTQESWNSFSTQKAAPILLAGDVNGNVWYMDNENALTDNGTLINIDVITTRWNPVVQVGQKVQFGWIDIYYRIVSFEPTNPIQVTLNFFADNSNATATTRTLTLDGPPQSEYTFKRIYVNLIGEFFQMEIDPDEMAAMEFIGFILWAKPAGRLTP